MSFWFKGERAVVFLDFVVVARGFFVFFGSFAVETRQRNVAFWRPREIWKKSKVGIPFIFVPMIGVCF